MNFRNTYKYIVAAVLSALALASCIKQPPVVVGDPGAELTSIQAGVATRAGEIVGPSTDYVGRSKFADEDRIVFKTIKRKDSPIAAFTYTDIEFVASVKTENGKESIGWSRDKTKGHTESGVDRPDRIYWSDASNPHVFVGYCAPQEILDWHLQDGVYYGTLGAPGETGMLDFKTGGNTLLCQNDVLLTYSDEIKADDAIAKLQFYHGLAQVRVIVNISEFAAGGGDDKHSVVSDMILNNMPTQYRWSQTSVATQMAAGSALRNVNLWIPNPEGVGADANKTFTFYGLAVPRSVSVENPLTFSFTVTYPDAMNPSTTKSHTYNASIGGLSFTSGQCTTINISLNHQNEKITVGAEYDDWEFVESLDQGSLRKESVFLATLARKTGTDIKAEGVTILGDPLATLDDATWLYIDKTDPDRPVIRDIYGNLGTVAQPFKIKSAEQLLSLAYEVNGTSRAGETITFWTPGGPSFPGDEEQHDPVERTLPAAGNFDFQGYFISLEANLYLQPELETAAEKQLSWPGIGVYVGHENAGNKAFNGRLLAGVRIIKLLKGKPLFNLIGFQGHVDQLILEDVISSTGNAAFVEVNEGVICASKVGSKLTRNPIFNITGNNRYDGRTGLAPEKIYVGAFCGRNDGALLACYSTARIKATNAQRVGGIVGLNNGVVLCAYAAGSIDAPRADEFGIYGIAAGNGEVINKQNVTDPFTHTGELIFCVYDRQENTNTTVVPDPREPNPNLNMKGLMGSYAVTTSYLQSRAVVGVRGSDDPSNLKTLNGELVNWTNHPDREVDPETGDVIHEGWPEYLRWAYQILGHQDPEVLKTHMSERYYEYHVAAYPWVY